MPIRLFEPLGVLSRRPIGFPASERLTEASGGPFRRVVVPILRPEPSATVLRLDASGLWTGGLARTEPAVTPEFTMRCEPAAAVAVARPLRSLPLARIHETGSDQSGLEMLAPLPGFRRLSTLRQVELENLFDAASRLVRQIRREGWRHHREYLDPSHPLELGRIAAMDLEGIGERALRLHYRTRRMLALREKNGTPPPAVLASSWAAAVRFLRIYERRGLSPGRLLADFERIEGRNPESLNRIARELASVHSLHDPRFRRLVNVTHATAFLLDRIWNRVKVTGEVASYFFAHYGDPTAYRRVHYLADRRIPLVGVHFEPDGTGSAGGTFVAATTRGRKRKPVPRPRQFLPDGARQEAVTSYLHRYWGTSLPRRAEFLNVARTIRLLIRESPDSVEPLVTAMAGAQDRPAIRRVNETLERSARRLESWPRRIEKEGPLFAHYFLRTGDYELHWQLNNQLKPWQTAKVTFSPDGSFEVTRRPQPPRWSPVSAVMRRIGPLLETDADRTAVSDFLALEWPRLDFLQSRFRRLTTDLVRILADNPESRPSLVTQMSEAERVRTLNWHIHSGASVLRAAHRRGVTIEGPVAAYYERYARNNAGLLRIRRWLVKPGVRKIKIDEEGRFAGVERDVPQRRTVVDRFVESGPIQRLVSPTDRPSLHAYLTGFLERRERHPGFVKVPIRYVKQLLSEDPGSIRFLLDEMRRHGSDRQRRRHPRVPARLAEAVRRTVQLYDRWPEGIEREGSAAPAYYLNPGDLELFKELWHHLQSSRTERVTFRRNGRIDYKVTEAERRPDVVSRFLADPVIVSNVSTRDRGHLEAIFRQGETLPSHHTKWFEGLAAAFKKLVTDNAESLPIILRMVRRVVAMNGEGQVPRAQITRNIRRAAGLLEREGDRVRGPLFALYFFNPRDGRLFRQLGMRLESDPDLQVVIDRQGRYRVETD